VQESEFNLGDTALQANAAALPDLQKAEREVLAIQSDENRLRMEVGMVRQLVAVLDTQRERKARFTARRGELALTINRFKALERAFSKDGVPALLIEQALPEIEAQANDILDRLSQGGMSVRFATQRQLKSKDEMRETLDIMISDASGVREYEMFSGGEAFRVNFAIRLALSRVLAHRAGARLQTLFIDEGFGSQDADGRQRLLEAISLVQPEFARILVITHLEELKEAFPARIEVEKTLRGSRLRVVA
jgi:exonuclease SbcC